MSDRRIQNAQYTTLHRFTSLQPSSLCGAVTKLERRRTRAKLYDTTLDLLLELTTLHQRCSGAICEEVCRRRVGTELMALAPELARLGSPRITDLIEEICQRLVRGRAHEPEPVIEVALLMAADAERDMGGD